MRPMRTRILAGILFALCFVLALRHARTTSAQVARGGAAGKAELALPLPTVTAVSPAPAPDVPVAEGPEPARATDDPMQAVEQFVERSRKEADEKIKALAQEREALR